MCNLGNRPGCHPEWNVVQTENKPDHHRASLWEVVEETLTWGLRREGGGEQEELSEVARTGLDRVGRGTC